MPIVLTAASEVMPGETGGDYLGAEADSPAELVYADFEEDLPVWDDDFIADGYIGIQPFLQNPTWPATRAEMITMLLRGREPNLLNNGETPNPSPRPFNDLWREQWFYPPIMWAAARGWVSGSGGAFRPTTAITREEMIVMAVNVMNPPSTNLPQLNFTDNHLIASWAVQPLRRALAAGWISGYPDGSFRPQGQVSRQNVLPFVRRVTNNNSVTFPGGGDSPVITWNSQGGTSVAGWNRLNQTAIGRPLPTTSGRDNYNFAGWWTTATTGGTQVTQATRMPTANVTYHARWVRQTVTVSWNTRGGHAISNWHHPIHRPLQTLPTPTRPNATFERWVFVEWRASMPAGNVVNVHTAPSGNVTYHAIWYNAGGNAPTGGAHYTAWYRSSTIQFRVPAATDFPLAERAAWTGGISDAIAAWNAHTSGAAGTGVTLQANSTSNNRLRVLNEDRGYGYGRFYPEPPPWDLVEGNVGGVNGPRITRFDVTLNRTLINGRPNVRNAVQAVAAHELAHIMGLAHNFRSTSITNSAASPGGVTTPDATDVRNVRLLYVERP